MLKGLIASHRQSQVLIIKASFRSKKHKLIMMKLFLGLICFRLSRGESIGRELRRWTKSVYESQGTGCLLVLLISF